MSLAASFASYVSRRSMKLTVFIAHKFKCAAVFHQSSVYILSPLFSSQQYVFSGLSFLIYRCLLFAARGLVSACGSVSCHICQTAGLRRDSNTAAVKQQPVVCVCVGGHRRAVACSEIYCFFKTCQDPACP